MNSVPAAESAGHPSGNAGQVMVTGNGAPELRREVTVGGEFGNQMQRGD